MNETRRAIDALAGAARPGTVQRLQEVLAHRTRYVTAVLEDLFDSQNAATIVRTCECLGMQEVHVVVGRHPFRPKSQVLRGAEKWIDVVKHMPSRADDDPTATCLAALRGRGYALVATTLREGPGVIPLHDLPVERPLALCFGLEQTGLSETAHAAADYHVTIPMRGFTQSLNVASSAAICLYSVMHRARAGRHDTGLQPDDRDDVLLRWLRRSVRPAQRD
jgi:tRNA (guanosine-2'-O-)-methyltransferase